MAPERISDLETTEGPSREEVRRRIDRLYDRAENDSGTFNATRAASIPRQRGGAGRNRSRQDADEASADLTRQWFDVARTKLGPTVPVPQSDARTQARPARAPQAARSERPAERPAEPLALEAPRESRRPPLELTAGPAPTPTMASLPELTAGPSAPAVPHEPRPEETTWNTGALPVLDDTGAQWQLPAPAPEPAQPTVQDPATGFYDTGLTATGMTTYGTGWATDTTGTYTTGLWTDQVAASAYIADPLFDTGTSTYGAGFPTGAVFASPAVAPAEPAPVTQTYAPAPATWGGTGQSADAGHRSTGERVVAFAREQIGRPCVWGAVGPGSYDAPGLAQAAWKTAGVTLPRTVQAQSGTGTPIALADVQAGDLIFFHDDLSHVGVWTGNGMMIHAPGPGASIREESVFFAGQSAIRGAMRPA